MAKLMFAYKISIGYPLIMLALFALIVILQEHLAYGKPPYDVWPDVRKVINGETDCSINGEVETLCQKCAKQTKSTIVYPMCCQNSEEARQWCERYMSFGLQ